MEFTLIRAVLATQATTVLVQEEARAELMQLVNFEPCIANQGRHSSPNIP